MIPVSADEECWLCSYSHIFLN